MLALLMIALAVLGAGAFLMAVGLRGRRVDDHPLCRRCGFDLTGKPETSNLCSECGADLTQPHAIRTGHREPRRPLVHAGVALGLLGLISAGVLGWAIATVNDWQAVKPVWWLMRETYSSDVTTRNGAMGELVKRSGAAKLTAAQTAALCDRILEIQADRNIPWIAAWGDIVENARANSKLSDARWKQYAEHAPDYQLDVRPRVRFGDPIYYWIREHPARLGRRQQIHSVHQGVVWDIGPLHLERKESVRGGGMLSVNGGGATGTSIDADQYASRLKPGDYTVKYVTTAELRDSGAQGTLISSKTLELTAPLKLLPPQQSSVKVIKDESFRAALEKTLTTPHLSVQSGSVRYLSASVSIDGPPVGIGFEVFALFNGEEVRLGRFAAPAGKRHAWGFGGGQLDFDVPDRVDVRFTPSTQAAVNTSDTFEIWDGEIVLHDVAVNKPSTGQATSQRTIIQSQPARGRKW